MEKYLVRVAYTGVANPLAATSPAATYVSVQASPLQSIDANDPVQSDVRSVFPADKLALLRHGLALDGQPSNPPGWIGKTRAAALCADRGQKRQIRRMCELVGLKVVGEARARGPGAAGPAARGPVALPGAGRGLLKPANRPLRHLRVSDLRGVTGYPRPGAGHHGRRCAPGGLVHPGCNRSTPRLQRVRAA